MKIINMKLKGFKCFDTETAIDFANMTTLIGGNGCGKSSILEALLKIFGTKNHERQIMASDFYIKNGEQLDSQPSRVLSIDVQISFDEIDENSDSETIAAFFKHYFIDNTLLCRVRLEAEWVSTSYVEGIITQNIYWVTTLSNDLTDNDKIPARNIDLAKIHVYYIPALRDPVKEIKQTAGSIMQTLMKAAIYSKDFFEQFNDLNYELRKAFCSELPIRTIEKHSSEIFSSLFDSNFFKNINLSLMDRDISKVLTGLVFSFSLSETGEELDFTRLSDGMKSIFYITLIVTLLEIYEKLHNKEEIGFDKYKMDLPYLSIIAFEEPENHMSPHYLGKIISLLKETSCKSNGQVIIATHSPSIMNRIEPEDVRYLRLNEEQKSTIKSIVLPDNKHEAFKYVKEAIMKYPELYFSKGVIFGEGDSEELVIPKVAKAMGKNLDVDFISVIPLGGRHVNHFWKLCTELSIPHVTLLDYDNYRDGGNWQRIKYVLDQLIKNGHNKNQLLTQHEAATIVDLDSVGDNNSNEQEEKKWRTFLETYDIYFSYPYDLDFMLLQKFYDKYTVLEGSNRGPSIPDCKDSEKYNKYMQDAVDAVHKKSFSGNLTVISDHYPWYRYLFLSKEKPYNHFKVFDTLTDAEINNGCILLSKVINKIYEKISRN